MSSDPNTNDEGPQPSKRPKSQPTTVAKEISEVDFWDLDEEADITSDSGETTVLPQPRQKAIQPRHPAKKAVKKVTTPKVKPVEKPAAPVFPESEKPAEKKKLSRMKSGSAPPQMGKRYGSSTSDDLGSKELEGEAAKKLPEREEPEAELSPDPIVEHIEEIEAPPQVEEIEPIIKSLPEADSAPETLEPESQPAIEATAPQQSLEDLKGKLKLSQVEKIGMGAFAVILISVAIFFLTQGIYKLPAEPKLLGSDGFPVSGELLDITEAETFWRKPIIEGANPDRVRRLTKLIPVLKISVADGKGAIRVLFRDENRKVIGDGITRAAKGNTTLEIPATAGFEEPGMHAAYRTGEKKPWKVEVFEAPSTEAATNQFKKIYEAHISSEQR